MLGVVVRVFERGGTVGSVNHADGQRGDFLLRHMSDLLGKERPSTNGLTFFALVSLESLHKTLNSLGRSATNCATRLDFQARPSDTCSTK